MKKADVAVVGGGIIGLATAFAQASRGRQVTLFERTDFAIGASVRNFGLLWPVGQKFGKMHDRAMRSREIWLRIIQEAGLWHAPTGSLHLAYAPDELALLEEFLALDQNHGRRLLTPAQTLAQSSSVKPAGLLGALWSPTEINIDPRQAVRTIPKLLAERYDVELQFGVNVSSIDLPKIVTSAGTWEAERVFVCSGTDFEMLYPEVFAARGLTRCKLQMMRTGPQPGGWHLGPSICAGLTLTHYESFKACPTLPALKARFARELPFCVEHGIHVLVSETALGEITLGDSHHYGLTLEPFDREEINRAILDYLDTFAILPSTEIRERWNGQYPKHPQKTEIVETPAPGVTIVNGVGGAGMTLSFGLADELAG